MSWMWRVGFCAHTHTHGYTHPSPWHPSPPIHSPCHAKRSVHVCARLKEREEMPQNITAWLATPSSNAKAAGWPFVMYINLCRSFTWQAIVPHDPTASSLPPSLLPFEQVGRIVCREACSAVPLSVVVCVWGRTRVETPTPASGGDLSRWRGRLSTQPELITCAMSHCLRKRSPSSPTSLHVLSFYPSLSISIYFTGMTKPVHLDCKSSAKNKKAK